MLRPSRNVRAYVLGVVGVDETNAVHIQVQAQLAAQPHGCVGWFMDLDGDCDGYVSAQDMIDALLLLPCKLTTHQAVEFVAAISADSQDVSLSSLWIALQCPDLQAQTEADECGGGRRRISRAPASGFGQAGDGAGYQFYLPDLTSSQFHVEVFDMSRAATEHLASVSKRLERLQAAVDMEERTAHDITMGLHMHHPSKLHIENQEIAVALERARATTATEARRTQAAARRLSMVQQQIRQWTAHRAPPNGNSIETRGWRSPRDSSLDFSVHGREERTERAPAPRRQSLKTPSPLREYEGSIMRRVHPDEYARLTASPPPMQLTEDPRLVQVHTHTHTHTHTQCAFYRCF